MCGQRTVNVTKWTNESKKMHRCVASTIRAKSTHIQHYNIKSCTVPHV